MSSKESGENDDMALHIRQDDTYTFNEQQDNEEKSSDSGGDREGEEYYSKRVGAVEAVKVNKEKLIAAEDDDSVAGSQGSYSSEDSGKDGRTGTELEALFTADVTSSMHSLWKRVERHDYNSKAEEDQIMFELMHYLDAARARVSDHYREQIFAKTLCYNPDDEAQSSLSIKLPYVEAKAYSESCRALFWQIFLELTNEITDVLFLFVLADSGFSDLFYASLVTLVVAVVFRLFNGIYLGVKRLDRRYWALCLIGLVIGLFETNSGLLLMKQSLIRVDKNGLVEDLAEGKANKRNKDEVSLRAQNNLHAGWAEIRFILSVTVMEDLPQLAIQVLFIIRQQEEVAVLFYFTLASTVGHLLFQWIEMAISLHYVRPSSSLSKIVHFRELDPRLHFRHGCAIFRTGGYSDKSEFWKFVETVDGSMVRGLGLTEYTEFDENQLVRAVKRFTNLRTMLLDKNVEVDDELVAKVTRYCPNLEELYLDQTAIVHCMHDMASNCRQIKRITFNDTLINDEGLEALASSNRGIKVIWLNATQVGDAGIKSLAKTNSEITSIAIDNTHVGDEGIKALAKTNRRINFIKLDENAAVGDDGIIALAETNTKINTITMNETSVGDPGVVALARTNSNIKTILMNNTYVGDTGVHALTSSNRRITIIWLDNTSVGDKAMEALAKTNCNMQNISIRNTKIGDVGIMAIAETNSSIRDIWLNSTAVGNEGIKALAKTNSGIETILLSKSAVGDPGIQALAKRSRGIKVISLSNTLAGNPGIKVLARTNTGITRIWLDNTSVDDDGIQALAKTNHKITNISLEQTSCGDAGIKALAARNFDIKYIFLTSTTVSDTGITSLARTNSGIVAIMLSHTTVGDRGIIALAKTNHRIQEIVLNSTLVGEAGIYALAQTNSGITYIGLRNTSVGEDAIAALVEANRGIKVQV